MREGLRDMAALEIEKDPRPFLQGADGVPPERGWLRELRQSYGVPASEIAKRLGVSEHELFRLERGEVDGTITLKQMRKVAEAMACQVVYGVVWRERPTFSKAAEMADEYLWKKRFHRTWR